MEGIRAAAETLPLPSDDDVSFRDYIQAVRPAFQWWRHIEILVEHLQAVADGEILRLAVYMPPRHGKSETVSRLFPGYTLTRHPERWVGLCSHTAPLAYSLSRNARENFRRYRNEQLSEQAKAVALWETDKGGGMWAAGVGGAIHGKGFHYGLIDDPIRGAEDAKSQTVRDKQWNWYEADFGTRKEPGAAIVICQTRWNEDDLSGRIMEKELQDDEPEEWTVLDFPALYDPKNVARKFYPVSVTVVADWRSKVDESLCPERFSEKTLVRTRARMTPYYWNSLFQQRPRPSEGTFFKREWFHIVDKLPAGSSRSRCRGWDKGGTDEGDFTAGVRINIVKQKLENGEQPLAVCFDDVVRGQWTPGVRDVTIQQTIESDGKGVKQWVEQEPGSAGIDSVRMTSRTAIGFTVRGERATGSKEIRNEPLASWAEIHGIYLLRGDWNKPFVDELCDFPHGTYDDQADAAGLAFNKAVGRQQPDKYKPVKYSSVRSGKRQRA